MMVAGKEAIMSTGNVYDYMYIDADIMQVAIFSKRDWLSAYGGFLRLSI